ncbi:Aste57867_10473 [Aphanomyces stellatus]|uniref:Aste57867_10473 protein n=1 Tax=Aphanomyces stellatus TaxID=120398 RepID=A0A485KR21_9STRA|nr:hypothetical protein As57867_010433 [Aphanomyces stellatus]VFT87347.1 Aste57867_10473 [Aphanomyces stellatus]
MVTLLTYLHTYALPLTMWTAIISLVIVGFARSTPSHPDPPVPYCLQLPRLPLYFTSLYDLPSTAQCQNASGLTGKIPLALNMAPTGAQVAAFFDSDACRSYFDALVNVYVKDMPRCLFVIDAATKKTMENSALAQVSFDQLRALSQAYQSARLSDSPTPT